MKSLAVAVLILLSPVAIAQYCPVLDCSQSDRVFTTRGSCYWARADNNGKISKIYMGSCGGGTVCDLLSNQFVWLNTDLQMRQLSGSDLQNTSLSQFYYKKAEGKCMVAADSIYTRLNNGRNCIYNIQCISRVCDSNNNVCDGTTIGGQCSSHVECMSDLACRVQTVWPYQTTCQPRGESLSLCETDYDCKMRNFCWKLTANDTSKVCLEMFNAPYGNQFFWDSVQYPVVNKQSVLFHGQYCQSGYALRRSQNVAECVNIQNITMNKNGVVTNMQNPYQCTPDGATICEYRDKNGNVAFSLTCECAMMKDSNNVDIGYCPLGDQALMLNYIHAMKQVFYQDNCSTLDRNNFPAMIECGVGNYDTRLSTAVDYRFQALYYPWVQDGGQKACLEGVFPDGAANIFV